MRFFTILTSIILALGLISCGTSSVDNNDSDTVISLFAMALMIYATKISVSLQGKALVMFNKSVMRTKMCVDVQRDNPVNIVMGVLNT